MPPVISTIPDQELTQYIPYSLYLSDYTTSTEPVTSYTIVSGTLPAGLSFNSVTGHIYGTPSLTQLPINITVFATSDDGDSDESTFSMEVLVNNSTLCVPYYRKKFLSRLHRYKCCTLITECDVEIETDLRLLYNTIEGEGDSYINILTENGIEYEFTINWGDGTIENYSGDGGDIVVEHTYIDGRTQATVSIDGVFPRFGTYGIGDQDTYGTLVNILNWGDIVWASDLTSMFSNYIGLSISATDTPDLSNVTSMFQLFLGATDFNSNINNWDVSNVEVMGRMFSGATAFNQPLDTWNTSNVTSMNSMFANTSAFNQDISSRDVSNVTNISSMFNGAIAFNQDISGWDVSSVTTMQATFQGASSFNQNLNDWDVSNVASIRNIFTNAILFNQPLSDWDVSSVTNMQASFQGAAAFNQDISSWDTSLTTNMSAMFNNATAFNQDLSGRCVTLIPSLPTNFKTGSALTNPNTPVRGTCP